MHGVASNNLQGRVRRRSIRSRPLEEVFTLASVERAGFSRRILTMFLNSMKRQFGGPSINTVGELLTLSERQFKNHIGIGSDTFSYVKSTLEGHGLALKSPSRV